MSDWEGWEVVCLERSGDSPQEDCRAIEALGHRVANSVRTRGVDTIHAMIDSGVSQFYVAVDGQPQYLEPATHDGQLYVRTLETDAGDDPLLSLPTCTEHEADH